MHDLARDRARPMIATPVAAAHRPRKHLLDRSDRLWFKDAVIYQLHVKAYFDSNNDGIGDFAGLTQKLDYLKDMGATALWLLPFYRSPLRDDGYDISDYRAIHPSYGTMRDFRRFVDACHERGLRVVTELVINHTSDQHPWFQRARHAKAGSAARDYYVWSDTNQRLEGTRIIFLDTESSNWTWDPVANAYYWHRFYSHQPDLNFDNPRVFREVVSIMNFWLSCGVDGLRLDAVPYLIEREGTSNENLPETHDVLKRIRAEVDARFPDRMLLAEANQWPEDVLPYFGAGDECHMAFHFPLMPRMYMAIAREDRHPVTDIMRQTPDIPSTCQWAIFLRNHDELTLEMVTDKERDYLWDFYAVDRRMRINLGIRRRLAPLMENDRRKIELMNGLLLSLPGTPVIYYGDEIGMGDNIFLGDRDGVRTPMHWSPDRNAGFSRADPARLFLPPIMDPIYGFTAVNVEAQLSSASSLLNWTRRTLAVRQGQRVFGRGTLDFLYPGNRKILAFLRSFEDKTVLCVFNLARSAQAVGLDLSRFKGRIPIELMGRSAFPPIGDLPYQLTLPGYSFYWFALAGQEELPNWHAAIPEPVPEFVTLVAREGWRDILKAPARTVLENEALAPFFIRQRWFAAKDDRITSIRIVDATELRDEAAVYLLTQADVALARGETQRYLIPLSLIGSADASGGGAALVSFMVAQVRRGAKLEGLYDGIALREFPLALVRAIASGNDLAGEAGRLRCTTTEQLAAIALAPDVEVRRLGADQSNSSVIVGDQIVVKVYRRLIPGVHPEVEFGTFLAKVGYENTPAMLGAVEHLDARGAPTALAVVQAFVRNQGDGWTFVSDHLHRLLEAHETGAAASEMAAPVFYPGLIATMARRVAELHRALAMPTGDPAFEPQPISPKDLLAWRGTMQRGIKHAFAALNLAIAKLSGSLHEEAKALHQRKRECLRLIDKLFDAPIDAVKTRIHGDLHLGQVLLAQTDWYVIDFEGEPAKDLTTRRSKHSPLRDVAGMLRSFDYAARAALQRSAITVGSVPDTQVERALAWRDETTKTFLAAYRETAAGSASYPRHEVQAQRLLDLFLFEKACYELRYEAANRPDWVGIPIKGLNAMLDAEMRRTS
jgi:maltose alpha-D-glucosyltransferase/alpha-amylase